MSFLMKNSIIIFNYYQLLKVLDLPTTIYQIPTLILVEINLTSMVSTDNFCSMPLRKSPYICVSVRQAVDTVDTFCG